MPEFVQYDQKAAPLARSFSVWVPTKTRTWQRWPLPPATTLGNWIVDQLRRLAELRDEGVVSAEEFDRRRPACWVAHP